MGGRRCVCLEFRLTDFRTVNVEFAARQELESGRSHHTQFLRTRPPATTLVHSLSLVAMSSRITKVGTRPQPNLGPVQLTSSSLSKAKAGRRHKQPGQRYGILVPRRSRNLPVEASQHLTDLINIRFVIKVQDIPIKSLVQSSHPNDFLPVRFGLEATVPTRIIRGLSRSTRYVQDHHLSRQASRDRCGRCGESRLGERRQRAPCLWLLHDLMGPRVNGWHDKQRCCQHPRRKAARRTRVESQGFLPVEEGAM